MAISTSRALTLRFLLLLVFSPFVLSLTADTNKVGITSSTDASDIVTANGPIHVFRDPATGNLVESSEPETTTTSQTSSTSSSADDAFSLANKLDALYMDDVAVRSRNRHMRGGLSDRLGRKSLAGVSSDAASAAISASSSALTGRRQRRARVSVTAGVQ